MGLLRIIKLQHDGVDKWNWIHDASLCYLVKSAYKVIWQVNEVCAVDFAMWNSVWKSWGPFKTRALAWRIILDRLPSRWNLAFWGGNFSGIDIMCIWCQSRLETIDHLFFSCQFYYEVWQLLYGQLGLSGVLHSSPKSHWFKHLSSFKGGLVNSFGSAI
ncbi:PREDICTED: uncharacterized protein LOC109329330 [Lupinus angustifolius]|uniref:uncharacterized protein LOC109329330 n=1 Tax=Lupinus angustifolius TaxID=3871 RepID=UPI00092E9F0F|nr:PREDICTED: uncharacterized protein LOC109329330 [Lupinus angustifolius]